MVTIETVLNMKKAGEKIACLTAYDYPLAKILDEAGLDIILVGDSAANVFAGERTTLPITMEEMLYHTKVVCHGVKNALVVADMPFLSYQTSVADAVRNAGRFLKIGASAVKLEGAEPVIEAIKRLVELGIPVMGHVGLTPQSIRTIGGYKLQGTTDETADRIAHDAQMLEAAGCFSVVLEKIPASLAQKITIALSIPTIGIGAGPHCDGQILVLHDILGLFQDFMPKYVKRYAQLGETVSKAVKQYRDDVKKGAYPAKEHSF
jgi:3-methyl-2-oxobutanoate hydroxymethyltransferase